MQQLDSNVQSVIAEGEGSTRTIRGSFDRGRMYFDNDTKSLVYELETDADVISPQVSTREGNVILSSSANVEVSEETVDGEDCYMMKNEHIDACIKDVGSSDSYEEIDTSDLLVLYRFKGEDSDRELDANVSVELNGKEATTHGEGYTTAETGNYIGTGQVTATVASEYGFTYDVVFQLPTGSDFLQVDVQNFR
jgi:hypothetical protein